MANKLLINIFMRTKSLLTLLLGLFLTTQTASAIDGLWLMKHDGTLIGYTFDQYPTIGYHPDTIKIITSQATVGYPFDEVRKIYFGDNVNEIKDLTVKPHQKIRATSNGLFLEGFAAKMPVLVCDVNGRTVLRANTATDGKLAIDMRTMPKGLYIVSVEKNSIKFTNR